MATESDNGIWRSFGCHLRTSTRIEPRSMSNDVQADKLIPKPFSEKSFGAFKIRRYNVSKLITVVCPMVATSDCWRVFCGTYLSRRRIETTAAVRRGNMWFGLEAQCGPGSVDRCTVHFSNGLTKHRMEGSSNNGKKQRDKFLSAWPSPHCATDNDTLYDVAMILCSNGVELVDSRPL